MVTTVARANINVSVNPDNYPYQWLPECVKVLVTAPIFFLEVELETPRCPKHCENILLGGDESLTIFIMQKKFSINNIQRYVDFSLFISFVDPTRIKFMDEGYFVSKSLFRRRAVGPIGSRVFAVRSDVLDENLALTMTLCTSTSADPRHAPVWAETTYGGNTAVNWAHVIFNLLDSGFLQKGDLLVMDNAKVKQCP